MLKNPLTGLIIIKIPSCVWHRASTKVSKLSADQAAKICLHGSLTDSHEEHVHDDAVTCRCLSLDKVLKLPSFSSVSLT